MKNHTYIHTFAALAICGLSVLSTPTQATVTVNTLWADSFEVGGSDYSTGLLAGQNGTRTTPDYETGTNANWTGGVGTEFGDPGIVSGGLSYTGLYSNGGSILLERTSSDATLTKFGVTNPDGTPSDTPSGSVYFSGMIRLGNSNWASIGLDVGKNILGVGINSGGFGEIRADSGADVDTVSATSGSALSGWSSGDTIFVVGKVENEGGSGGADRVSLFLNPNLASEGTADVFVDVGTDGWFPSSTLDGIGVYANLNGQQTGSSFDEIRIGETWDSVTVIPEPGTLVLLGVALGAMAIFRRRR